MNATVVRRVTTTATVACHDPSTLHGWQKHRHVVLGSYQRCCCAAARGEFSTALHGAFLRKCILVKHVMRKLASAWLNKHRASRLNDRPGLLIDEIMTPAN